MITLGLIIERIVVPCLVAGICALCGWIARLLCKQTKQFRAISKATRASLHDRLKWESIRIIEQGFRTSADSKNLIYMYEGYDELNGNSIIEDLYSNAMATPIKEVKK